MGVALLFRFAPREPEFLDVIETSRVTATEITDRYLADVADDRWRSWAAALLPTVTADASSPGSMPVNAIPIKRPRATTDTYYTP